MTENILIQFDSDVKGITTATDAVDQLATADKELASEFVKTNKAIKDRDSALSKSNSALSEYTQKIKGAEKAAAGAFGTKGLKEFEKAINNSTNDVKVLDATVKLAKKNLDQFKPGSKEWAEFNDQIEKGETLLKALEVVQKTSNKEFKNFKTEVREINEALQKMEEAGLETTDAFTQLATRSAQLTDQIGDTQERIRALASDTANIDAVVEGVGLMASGFQFAAGAEALFGDESEEVQKVLVKLNAIMAITQSIQQAQNFLRGQSILRLKAEAAYNAVLAASTRATAATYATLGITVNGTSFAFKALRAAMITTGVGALVVGLGYLVNKMMELSESTKTEAEAQEELNQKMADFKEKLDAVFKSNPAEVARSGRLKAIEREIKLLEAQGGKEKQLADLRKEKADIEIRSSMARQATLAEFTDVQAEEAEKQKDVANELAVQAINDARKVAEKQKDEAEKAAEKKKEIAERNSRALFDIEERRLQGEAEILNRSISETSAQLMFARLAFLTSYISKEQEVLRVQMRAELSNRNLTGAERANIEDKYNKQIEKLTQDSEGRKLGIIRDNQNSMREAWAESYQKAEENRKADEQRQKEKEDAEIERQDAMVEAAINRSKRLREAEIEETRKTEEAKQRIRQLAMQTVDNLLQIVSQNNNARIEGEIARITELKDKKIITEEEATNRIRGLRRKAAADEKKMALFSALLSQSQAVLAVLADKTIPAVIKPFVLAATIAQAVSQIALIASRPLPQLYRGTKKAKEGIYRTGELGQELLWHKGQAQLLGKRGEEVNYIPEGARVFNAVETADILKNMPHMNFDLPTMAPLPKWAENSMSNTVINHIDTKAIGEELRTALKELPSYEVNIDKSGIHVIAKEGIDKTEFINNKYSFKR